MPWTLLTPDTIPRQALKPAQQKTSATVARNLGPHKSLKHMKSSMSKQVWACFECNKESKGNDKHSVYKQYRIQHDRRHLHQCTFATCSIDGHPYGNDEQYTVWWHMQEDHGLQSPLGCPKCDGTFCSKQTQQKHIPSCPGKKISLAQNKPLMLIKDSNVMSVQRNTPHRLHYVSTRRCTKVLTRSMYLACVVKLSVHNSPPQT